jgi:hypothetical protein
MRFRNKWQSLVPIPLVIDSGVGTDLRHSMSDLGHSGGVNRQLETFWVSFGISAEVSNLLG